MRETLPDETGWYWFKYLETGEWNMAHIDQEQEKVTVFIDANPAAIDVCSLDEVDGDRHWYGPFNCPGTDFGQHTIVMGEEQHQKAERHGEAIVLTYADFCHCDDLHSSIAIIGRRSEEAAKAIIQHETRKIGVESELVKLFRELDTELNEVPLPATAASVVSGIRSMLKRLKDDEDA